MKTAFLVAINFCLMFGFIAIFTNWQIGVGFLVLAVVLMVIRHKVHEPPEV